ncbi:MAG: sigma-70 family RNA polymerase sigma factor [Acidobacteriota bacterium]
MMDFAKEELFERIFKEQSQKIFRWIYQRCRDKGVSEDITSECFIRTFERYSGSETDLIRILYRVADNLLTDFFRDRIRRERLTGRLTKETSGAGASSPEREVVEREEEHAAGKTVQQVRLILQDSTRLNDMHKRYLFMRLFENKMPKEIAAELSTDYIQVKNYLQYGLKILKEELQRASRAGMA